MPPVNLNQVPTHYHKYLAQVNAQSLAEAFHLHGTTLVPFLQTIPEEKWDYRYAAGKWSIKESVQHVIDTERIFCYRALTIARKDNIALPGFDENAYTPASRAHRRTKESLLSEFAAVQQSSILLFESFDAEMLAATGFANGNPIYVEGIGYIIVGHGLHHLNIFRERYLGTTENQVTPVL